jgi:hypothetical protein
MKQSIDRITIRTNEISDGGEVRMHKRRERDEL